MKKRLFLLFIFLIQALLISSCIKSNSGVRINEDLNGEIIADHSKGFIGTAGSIKIEDGQKLELTSDLKKNSEILLKFRVFPALGIDAAAEELSNAVSEGEPVLEITVSESGVAEYELEPGEYSVEAEALSRSTGEIMIRVK